ncbi:hypothetical protein U1Q18_047071, partial [Sarracenia purpurea var. burkii]
KLWSLPRLPSEISSNRCWRPSLVSKGFIHQHFKPIVHVCVGFDDLALFAPVEEVRMGPHSLFNFPPLVNTVGFHSQKCHFMSSEHGNLAIEHGAEMFEAGESPRGIGKLYEDWSPQINPSYATVIVSGIVRSKIQDGLGSHKLGNLGQEILEREMPSTLLT